ncbi:MAG TPA: DUF983 domain-containing protein [Pyrinomonadaceae bacterium]|jgi:uncharacterized protein (DUF983 family)|nr:DUF983 domain-containing protein [Pyrinomonadaceae bacterium]
MSEGEKAARPDLLKTLARGLRLRCPVCGESNVFRAPFQVRRECPACGALFQREAGFFVGAIMVNVVVTEGAVMLAFAICVFAPGGGVGSLMLPVLFAVALLFPVLFYHHAWSLWLAGDHAVEGLPKADLG